MRKKAKFFFEKDLFKLFNNAIFGKTLENVRKRQRVELVYTNQQRKTKLEHIRWRPLQIPTLSKKSNGI